MGIVGVVSEVKKVHPKDLTIIDIGKFFYAYGKDAYILSYLFGYKLTKIEAILNGKRYVVGKYNVMWQA